jgi:hypothetical protein
MKKLVISTIFVMQVLFVFAQTGTGVSGKVLDSKTQKPLQNVVTSIQNTNLTEITDANGKFVFKNVSIGNQLLQIRSQGYKDQLLQIEIVKGKIIDIGIVVLDIDQTEEQQLSLITITENDLGDGGNGSESTAGLLQASRDAFQQAAAFNWGQARYRIRGLDNENAVVMINGVSMNKIIDNRPQWSNWGGLNDATRNQEFTMGSAPSDYTFGGILGTQEINTRASSYRKGSRITFSGTRTNYNWRTMGTHASGMNKNGWAFVVSASRRWAQEGFFEGTDQAANSVFASVEKKINEKHSLNFTSIYADNLRGRTSANTDEVVALKGYKYNSQWGYQDGRKRNARDRRINEPLLMLNHFWKISDKTSITSGITHQFGSIGNSRIDFQNAKNPDPTYYRNLPSFFTSTFNPDDYTDFQGNSTANLLLASQARNNFINDGQINWNSMYEANASTKDGRSVYVLYEDRTDDKLWIANSFITSQLADNITFNGGGTYKKLKSHNYQLLTDLLGGNYFNDIDNFQQGIKQQSDLNNPDRKVYEGDEYGYNYNLEANTIDLFTQFRFSYKKYDFYLGQMYNQATYQREGLYRNGIYSTNSFGKGEKFRSENFGFKGGLTYKMNGRNYFNFNAAYLTKAPAMRNVYPNARMNNNALSDLENEKISSADVSYIIRKPSFKARITAYASNIKNATETAFFFGEGIFDDADGDGGDAFVAETLTNIEKQNIGLEFGAEYKLTSTITINANAGYGEFIYKNNPNVQLSNDNLATDTNTNPVVDFGTAKLKGYRLPGGPQAAASLGIEYRDPKFWWIGANYNVLANNYVDVASLLRTDNFFKNPTSPFGLPFPEATNERASQLLAQERFDNVYLLNLVGGKSWKIKDKTFGFFASVNNVLDFVYKTGGFEQARNGNFREVNQDVSSGTPSFAPRYFYGFGRNYFLNIYLNF